MTRTCLVCLALVMVVSVACSKRHTRGGGMSRDAGPRADTGPVPDAGPGEDAGIVIMFDTGPRRDSGPVTERDSGPGTGCMGDRFDMAACGAADSACRYGETCPEAMIPPYDECFALLQEQFAMGRTAPDVVACIECLEAFDRAFVELAASGVCPPPPDPPPEVAAACDSNPSVDADGDGNPSNDIDVCNF